jgi:hypothetical protein
MRVGALLESGAETLEVRGRKENRDTLLDKNGTPLPAGDAALAGMLAKTVWSIRWSANNIGGFSCKVRVVALTPRLASHEVNLVAAQEPSFVRNEPAKKTPAAGHARGLYLGRPRSAHEIMYSIRKAFCRPVGLLATNGAIFPD